MDRRPTAITSDKIRLPIILTSSKPNLAEPLPDESFLPNAAKTVNKLCVNTSCKNVTKKQCQNPPNISKHNIDTLHNNFLKVAQTKNFTSGLSCFLIQTSESNEILFVTFKRQARFNNYSWIIE